MENWKKKITLFLTSQTISLFGSSLVQYAITWHITLKTQSGIMMALSIVFGFLPTFFVSPFAGVWADRYHKKTIIILSDGMIAISTLILAILFFMGNDSIYLLFAVSAIRSLGGGIQSPAVNAVVPSIVPSDKLMKVNGIKGSIQSITMLIAPMISGALMSIADIEYVLLLDVITAAVAIVVMMLFVSIPYKKQEEENQEVNYFNDLKEGFRYINNHAYIKKFFWFCGCFFVLASPAAFLTPLQVARNFGDEVWRLTTIEITFSVGMMLGGIAIAMWGGFKNKIFSMAVSCMFISIFTISFGFIDNFYLYAFIMGTFGLVMPLFNTPFTVLLQQTIEENYLGRVFGVLEMISSILMPAAMMGFGPLADIIKIEWLLIVTGIFMLIESVLLLTDKELKRAVE